MATRKLPPKKEPFRISSFALTSSTETTLTRISHDATDVIGRRVSDSAVVRALLRYVEQQQLSWMREQVYPYIEKEVEAGTLWGRRKGVSRKRDTRSGER